MSQQKEEILQKLLLNSLIFENLLKIFKIELYKEIIEHKKKVVNEILNSTLTNRSKVIRVKEAERELKIYQERVKRAEHIGLEITRDFNKTVSNFDYDKFTEDTADIYIPFTKILMDVGRSDIDFSTIIPALLIESEDGDIEVNNKKYKLLT